MDAMRFEKYRQRLYSQTPLIAERRWRKAAHALVQDSSPTAVQILAEAVARHDDARAREVMVEALRQLVDQRCIDAVCAVWAVTRHTRLAALLAERGWVASAPAEVKVLSALQAGRLDIVTSGSRDVINSLGQACEDADPTIAARARTCLQGLQNADAIDALCARWAKDRQALLTQVIEQVGYTARQPLEVRVLTALQVERVAVVTTGGAEVVEPILQACEDADPIIAARARQALHNLQNREAQETLCRMVLDSDHSTAREVARAAQYAPQELQQRALFYFLTEQWDKYENVDFDQTLLRAVYEVGDVRLRQRVAETARRAGRVEWIEVVTGGRQRRRLGEMTDGEWEATLAVLTAQKQGEAMWRLAQVAPAVWSVRLLHQLADMAWMPQAEQERTGFVEIKRLVAVLAGKTPELPKFVHSLATLGEPTREHPYIPVGCLAIGHDGRVLASGGTYAKTVRLWSVPDGEALRTLTGHTSWVTCLAMSPDGQVLASGSFDETVRLWSVPDGEALRTLTGHTSWVGCLAMSPDGRMLASGDSLDGTVRLWSMPDGEALHTLTSHDETVQLWSVPDGETPCTLTGVGCLAMSPDGRMLASGSRDGMVRLWSLGPLHLSYLPLGHTSVEDMALVQQTLQNGEASEAERGWLEFLLAMMRWRRRFDIGVGEASKRMEVGEFDIEIAG